jgi:RND family efflux transporter MFP subunit
VFKQLAILIVLGGLAGAAWHLGQPPEESASAGGPDRAEAAGAIVAPVGEGRVATRLEAVGTATALRSVDLHTEAAGQVAEVLFEADQAVEDGQVLLRLRQEAEQLDVDLTQVRLADARRRFERLETLRQSGTTTEAALDEARTEYQAARIALSQAQVALEDRTLRAPFAGRIGLTDIEVGDRVDPDTVIATLDARDALLVAFDPPEALLDRIRSGTKVRAAAWTQTGDAEGEVIAVDSRVDPVTRTFQARARIPNPDDRFRPGMSFRVSLDLEGARWPTVPEIAIQWGGEGAYVWTVRDGAAVRVPLTIVQRQETRVLIDADIEPGAPVVVEGLHRMREGRPVETETRAGAATAEAGS